MWADPGRTNALRLLWEREQSSLLSPSLLFKDLPWWLGYPNQGLGQGMKKGVFFQLSVKISHSSACSCPFSEAIGLLTDPSPHTRLTKEQMLETLGISLALLNVWTAYIWAEQKSLPGINMLWQSGTICKLILSPSWCGILLSKGCISCWCLGIATVFDGSVCALIVFIEHSWEVGEGFCCTASRHSHRICGWGEGMDKVAFKSSVCAVNSRLLPWINNVELKGQINSCPTGQSLHSTGLCCPDPEVPSLPSAPVLRSQCLQGLLPWWPCSCLTLVAPGVLSSSWSWESPWSTLNKCRINYSFTS